MATKIIIVVVLLYSVLWNLWQPTNGQSSVAGVYFSLNGQIYTNNSIVHISEIGQTDLDSGLNEGLQCVTNKRPCCKTVPYRTGEWCFPNGTKISVKGSKPGSFYRNRGDDGTVNLNRVSRNVVSPTGRFCCVVPNDTNVTQTLCINIQLELVTTTMSTSHENQPDQSGYFPYIIGGSIAGTVAVSIIITIPVTVVIFVLVLRYCRKRRFPRKHRYPPSAVRYTFQRNTGQQRSDIENCDNFTKSSGKVYATVHRAVANSYDSDTQEEYDDIIKSGIGTKYQNQTRTKVVMEEEYDDIIKSGTGIKYQNSTQIERITEEKYDNIIKSGTDTKYQNLTHQTEEVMEEYDDIVAH